MLGETQIASYDAKTIPQLNLNLTSESASPGDVIDGRYELQEEVRVGTTGRVFCCRDLKLNVKVAVKLVHEHLLESDEEKRFFVDAIKHVPSIEHASVIRCLDSGIDRSMCFVVFEWVAGRSLRDYLNEKREAKSHFSVAETLFVLLELCRLDAFSRRYGPHGNLRPENLILLPGQLKVADYGLNRALPRRPAQMRTLSPRQHVLYVAPEVREGGLSDLRSDVYSAGMMLVEMLTGRIAEDLLSVTHSLGGRIPLPLAGVVERSLSDLAESRYENLTAFSAALKEGCGGVEPTFPSLGGSDEVTRPRLVGLPPRAYSWDQSTVVGDPGGDASEAEDAPTGRFARGSQDDITRVTSSRNEDLTAIQKRKTLPEPESERTDPDLPEWSAPEWSDGSTSDWELDWQLDQHTLPEMNSGESLAPLSQVLADHRAETGKTSSTLPPLVTQPGAESESSITLTNVKTAPKLVYRVPMVPSPIEEEPASPVSSPRFFTRRRISLVVLVLLVTALLAIVAATWLWPERRVVRNNATFHSPKMKFEDVPLTMKSSPVDSESIESGEAEMAGAALMDIETCPDEMAVIKVGSGEVCMDRFESPGKGQLPVVGISHRSAELACQQRGYRLCTAVEWADACGQKFPYGATYRSSRCNTEANELSPAGEKTNCRTRAGIYDLSGNAAEWVAEGIALGGDYLDGQHEVSCRAVSEGGFRTGFRCCVDARADKETL